eukprot:NODE_38_length_35257_cov_0.939047.p13 type:complete len:281 gc:universal NODE_38_length_35257_cov_0.939047:11463-10621(-)
MEILKSKGLNASDLIIVHVYIQDMSLFGKFNALYGKLFTIKPPARACVQASLPKNILAKIDLTIAKKYDRKIMHVASISHAYPANIGPYSQCHKCLIPGGYSFIAGQVGFVPIKLAYPNANDAKDATLKQNLYSAKHVKSISEEMKVQPLTGVCFVRKSDCSSQIIAKFSGNFPNIPAFTVEVDRLPKDGEVEWLCIASETPQQYSKSTDSLGNVVFSSDKATIVLGNGNFDQYLLPNQLQSIFIKNLEWRNLKPTSAFVVPVNEITMGAFYEFAVISLK